MLNFINTIPNWLGWTITAGIGLIALYMAVKLTHIFIQMWKDNHEEDENAGE